MPINKVAVDEAAKKYWKMLFADMGYGEALVRDIPRRIKAALVDNKRVASVSNNASIIPIAVAKSSDNGIVIEGLFKDTKTKLLFKASLDNDGSVLDMQSVVVK